MLQLDRRHVSTALRLALTNGPHGKQDRLLRWPVWSPSSCPLPRSRTSSHGCCILAGDSVDHSPAPGGAWVNPITSVFSQLDRWLRPDWD